MNVTSQPARTAAVALLVISVGALGLAFTLDRVFDVLPCRLCIFQRLVYLTTVSFAIVAFAGSAYPRIVSWACLLSAAAFVVGAGIALHHVGVEHHWWGSLGSCGGELAGEISLTNLRERLQNTSGVACDEVMWRLFGFSLAEMNAASSPLLALAASIVGVRLRRLG